MKWYYKLGILLALAAGAALLYVTGIGCVYRHFFGVICPGCGMTHAILALLRLDLKTAWAYHPMVFSLPLLVLFLWKDGKLFPHRAVNVTVLSLIAAGFLVNYIHNLLSPNLLF